MQTIAGYTVSETIHESASTTLFRAVDQTSQQPVVLKQLNGTHPDNACLNRFAREYALTATFDSEHIIKAYGLKKHHNSLVIILEDFPSVALSERISAGNPPDLRSFLDIATQIAEGLRDIHQHNIIYKNLNPSNILYSAQINRVKIIDFSTAAQVTSEQAEERPVHTLTDMLPYLSPEQTGRLNSVIDYRTDFYSLGITLYHLFTGFLPFETDDPVEMLHCHLAKSPPNLSEIYPATPRSVSAIIMKLMEKSPDDRYQSCRGLLYDLHRCCQELEADGVISLFPLGKRDISGLLQIPARLFGRDPELTALRETFSAIRHGKSGLVMIYGDSGIGKTVLVDKFMTTIPRNEALCIRGKFMQSDDSPANSPLIQACQQLIRYLLVQSDNSLALWKKKIETGLGEDIGILLNLLPEVELLTEHRPTNSADTPKHPNQILAIFIRIFAQHNLPVILFLDDLQWAGSSFPQLLKLLLGTQPSGQLLLLGCSTNNGLPPFHDTLEALKNKGVLLHTIRLTNLNQEAAHQLLSQTFQLPSPEVAELADICLEKTGGNPLFLKQFLYAANKAGHISFNTSSQSWHWDKQALRISPLTDNIADLLLQRIATFPQPSQDMLKTAACLGNTFDLDTLAALHTCSAVEAQKKLLPCQQEGVLLSIATTAPTHESQPQMKFAHEQIRLAVHSLLTIEEKETIHLRAGIHLLHRCPTDQLEHHIFTIVHHLNRGIAHMRSNQEREDIMLANLRAGKKAKRSATYIAAHEYFHTALALLPENSWQENYPLALELHLENCTTAYLCGYYQELEKLFTEVRTHGASVLDTYRVYSMRIRAFKAQNRLAEAIATGLEVLKLFDIRFPASPTKLHIVIAFTKLRLRLALYSTRDLLNLPKMTNPKVLAIMDILFDLGTAAYYQNPKLIPLISCRAIELSLQYGNCALSAVIGYPAHGFLLCTTSGNSIDKGYRFGQLSLKLQHKLNNEEVFPQTVYLVNNLIAHWKEPLKNTIEPLKSIIEKCLAENDPETAANAAYSCSYRLYFQGANLSKAEKEIADYKILINKTRQRIPLQRLNIYLQAVANLLGENDEPAKLQGPHYDEQAMFVQHTKAGDGTTIFQALLVKLIHGVLFNRYEKAYRYGETAKQYLPHVPASVFIPIFSFYHALAQLAIAPHSNRQKQIMINLQVAASQRRMRTWAAHAPANYLHKFELVEAERARIKGNIEQAMERYDRAIHLAQQHESVHEEGLAYELAARFYANRGQTHIARSYLREARYCYYRWGATAKVNQLAQTTWPPISQPESLPPSADPILTTGGGSRLDMMTVIKASRILSGEMVLGELLQKMMRIMLESAGAQRGVLIFQEAGDWRIKVRGSVYKNLLISLTDTSVQSQNIASRAIIRYVIRTAEDVILNDAVREGLFTNDPYIIQKKPRSVLCKPIIHQDEVLCLLYLENNLTSGAFPPDRQELLTLLGTQAAISLKNSRLFLELNNTVERLNKEIERRKKTKLQLMHAEKLSALGRLSASIAHEFGNPLMGVKYLIDDFHNRSDLDEGDKKLVELGLEECERMKNLIRDLQQLHRPTSGKKTWVNLHKIIDNVIRFQKKHFSTHRIIIHTEFAPDIPQVAVVEDQITQVLFNLTMNAVDAIGPQGGKISITTARAQNGVTVQVADTGEGIPYSDQEHVFEPFFSTKLEEDGTGLGLSISYGIVQHHGGNLTFVSEPEKGTTFTLFLPTAP